MTFHRSLYLNRCRAQLRNGPIETVAKKRKQQQRQRRADIAPESRPQEIQSQGAPSEQDALKDTMAMVKRVNILPLIKPLLKIRVESKLNTRSTRFFEESIPMEKG